MSIKIITDSASDITQELAERLGITVLPITVTFNSEEYYDNVTLTTNEYYEKLIESDVLPKTSQITPYTYINAFEEALKENNYVICITLSKYLSGCYQSAMMAKDQIDNPNIFVVDSMNVAVGEKIVVELAHRLVLEGYSASDIAKTLEEAVKKVRLVALLDTLEYLKKGGRISSTVAFVGNLLSIKPVVEVDTGQVKMLGKARGSKAANNMLKEIINTKGDIDFDMPYGLAYSGLDDTLLKKYVKDNSDLYTQCDKEIPITQIGCTIGTHVGPGAIAVAFFAKNNN